MGMGHGSAFLLAAAAVGFLVLERADKHRGQLRGVGMLVGWLIILVSFAGVACNVWYFSSYKRGGWYGMGGMCPMKPGMSAPAPSQ